MDRGLALFARNLRTIGALTRARDIDLVLLTMPFDASRAEATAIDPDQAGMEVDARRFGSDMEAYRQTVLEVARNLERVSAVDMAEMITASDSLFVDVVHYNTKGIEIFGQALADSLASMVPESTPPITASGAAKRRCAGNWASKRGADQPP